MPQIFACPNCENPFQVPDDVAGQAFQCPSCKTTVQVPGPETPDEFVEHAEVFVCPHCDGQFGIDATMYGQELSCPHCEQAVAIGPPQEQVIETPVIDTEPEPVFEAETRESENEHDGSAEEDEQDVENEAANLKPVFEPQPVDHLLPPRFDVPDPIRFPTRIGSDEVILPDGAGGYQAVDANIVTITHKGEVYQLKRLTPEQRRRRKAIHNTIAISIAVLLIYLTLRTLGLV